MQDVHHTMQVQTVHPLVFVMPPALMSGSPSPTAADICTATSVISQVLIGWLLPLVVVAYREHALRRVFLQQYVVQQQEDALLDEGDTVAFSWWLLGDVPFAVVVLSIGFMLQLLYVHDAPLKWCVHVAAGWYGVCE